MLGLGVLMVVGIVCCGGIGCVVCVVWLGVFFVCGLGCSLCGWFW